MIRWVRAALYRMIKGQMIQVARERAGRLDESDPAVRSRIQLTALNRVWADAWNNVPYYGKLKNDHQLPDEFGSLGEYRLKMPTLQKSDVQANPGLFVRTDGKPDLYLKTGGSTGEPLRFGIWRRKWLTTGANYLIARSWFGVRPGDKLFMVWGRPYLMGRGFRNWLNAAQRLVQDRAVNYMRVNGSILTDDSLDRMIRQYHRFRPDYVLGYSSALDLMAHRLKGRNRIRPKVVIACAEAFPNPGSRYRISMVFGGAPVSMEYGSAECGLIAQEHPDGGFRVFWDTHLLETQPSVDGGKTVLVTHLTRLYFPLFRYSMGDNIVPEEESEGSLTRFQSISGRANDIIEMSDGLRLHPELITYAIRDLARVLQFQLVRRDGHPALIRIRMDGGLTAADEKMVKEKLGYVSEELARLPILEVDDMPKTAGGKVRWYVDE